jgi:hypothetical protein
MLGVGSFIGTCKSLPSFGVAFTGILDSYSGAAVAYSTSRRMSIAYTSSLIRVRRSSDNTEQDIGYDGSGNLDESALTSFIGANNGFIVKIYDQSGNGKNLYQSSASSQPKIVSSGSIIKVNNKPCAQFDATQFMLYNTANITLFSVTQFTNTTNGCAYSNDTDGGYLNIQISSAWRYYDLSGGYVGGGASNTNQNLFYHLSNGASSVFGINGSTNTGTHSSTYTNKKFNIGSATGTTWGCSCKIQEILIYSSNESSNRTGIQTNINDYYTIY